jgi:hypothetical protein
MSLIILALGATFFGIVLITLIALSDQKRKEREAQKTGEQKPRFERFSRACCDLVEIMKLEIDDIRESPEEDTIDIYATNPKPIIGGSYLIHCVRQNPHEQVSAAEIVEMSNAIIQDRLSKGIFITTGQFTPDLPAISELAPLSFIDGNELKKLAKEHNIIFEERQ